MAFDNATNRGRIEKIIEILGLIETSAKSNRAGPDDISDLLDIVLQRLTGMGVAQTSAAVPQNRQVAPQWATVRDMAQQASLADLTGAMAVYLNRIDEELHNRKGPT